MQTLAQLATDLAENRVTSRGTGGTLARRHRRSGGRRCAGLHHRRCGRCARCRRFRRPPAQAGRAVSPLAGIPFSAKDLFDLAGEVTTAGSKVLKGPRPRGPMRWRSPGSRRQGMIVIGPHQHDGIRLFGRRPQPALRHAALALRPRDGAHSRRVVLGGGRLRGGWHGEPRHRHRHGRLLPHSRPPIAASSATSRATGGCRSPAAIRCRRVSTRSGRSPTRWLLCHG